MSEGMRRVYSKACGCEVWVSSFERVIDKERVLTMHLQETITCPAHEFVMVLHKKGENSIK